MAAARSMTQRRQTLEGYKTMVEESHQRLCHIEEHLEHLVNLNRQSSARTFLEEHRLVSPTETVAGKTTFTIPQGESWVCERIAFGCGTATIPVYIYRDIIQDSRLAETATTDANGRYADAFSNKLWMPERTALIITGNTPNNIDASLQVLVLKRVVRDIPEEVAYAESGALEERGFDDEQAIWEAPEPGEPEPERHEPEEHSQPRPTAHFGERIEEAVEGVIDTVSEMRPRPHFRTPA